MEPTSEQLMVEMGWVRRLARALLHDDAAADEIAQETWLVATAQQPDADRPLRPWLARVVRNLVRTRRRGEARRDQREIDYEQAGGNETATPAQLVERVELQRVVAGEVLALAEPYRSTVLLHFFEGLSSVEIAQRLGIPDGTVRRRLKTALDQLRAQLQGRKDPPSRGWLAALAPLAQTARPVAPTPSIIGGALIVKKVVAVVVVVVVIIAGALLWKSHGRESKASATTTAAPAPQLRPVGGSHEIGHVPQWAVQEGAPARRIAGHVVSGKAAVAGAIVRLGLQIDGDLVQPLAEVTAGSDGAFDFGVQPPARFLVSAQAEGHTSGSVDVANADPRAKSDNLVIAVGDCTWRMDGTVSDASGGGIAGAHLSVDGLAGAESDASGHYAFCVPPREGFFDTPHVNIRIEADGYGTTTMSVILAGAFHQDFVMVPEAVLVGRVVTADDRPVAGARVIADPDASEGPHHVASNFAESDADGHFRIAGLAPGKFRLVATTRSAGSAVPQLAIAHATNTSKEIRLVIAPLARITGRVVMNGKPVAGAHVVATKPGPPGPPGPGGPEATSQEDGTFTLDGVAFGNAAFTARPFAVTPPKTLDVNRALIEGVELSVGKLATVRGHIFRKNKPVAGAEVVYMPETPMAVSTRSTADGEYVLEGLAPGDVSIGALSTDEKAYAEPTQLHLAAGEDRTQDISLDDAGEVIGTVVDETGKPVPNVYVRMDLADGTPDHCDAFADASGNFDCPSLAGGEYAPQVAPTPTTGTAFAPAVGEKLATIIVPKDGAVTGVRLAIKNERLKIRGTVLDDTGATVPDVHVEAIGHGHIAAMDLASVMSDANGKFEIDNLARGTYNLHAHAGDGSETEVLGIAAGGDPVTITLARPGSIEGTLVGFSTTPIVETNMLTADLHLTDQAVVEGNTFSQIGLTPGKYTVEAKAGAEIDGVSVDVHSGETVHVTLTSRGTGHVEGTVIELGTKAPVAGMRCDGNLSMGGQMSASPPDESRQAFTDATGHFSLATPTGRVRVFCFMPGGPPISPAGTDVDVQPGTTPHVSLIAVRPTFAGSPAKIGFDIVPITLPLTVNTVDPAGPAAAAGVAHGDHIITIDGQPVEGMLPAGATTMLFNHAASSTIMLGLERGGAARTAKLTVP